LEKWESVSGFLGDEESTGLFILHNLKCKEKCLVHTYTSLVFALQYCLPLMVLLVTYTFIGLRMWNSKVPGEGQQVSSSSQNGTAHYQPQQERRHESVKKVRTLYLDD